ncbi:hypothetical protein KC316_g4642 [Hortaea werneckii]|nr:hypothetical protein KC324_g3512 [Hortaea werneckii]KAI7588110.1 hypothetical protein KC316_g4642 [Hortaea werneckii]
MRDRVYYTRSNPTGGQRKEEEKGLGLGRERVGEGIGEGIGGGIGEGEGQSGGQGVGEGVRQGSGQGSDRFVVGKPYNENHDRDYRLSRRERPRGDESSEDESDSEESMDEE